LKLHALLIKAVVEALIEIFSSNRYADKVLETFLKSNPKWGARDRAFVAETTYDMVRNWRLLWALENKEVQLNQYMLIRLFGYYWLLKYQNNEGFLAVNQLFMSMGIKQPIDFERFKTRFAEIQAQPHILHSFPDWLMEVGNAELGEKWGKEIAALNVPAAVILRANTLKIRRSDLQNQLAAAGIETKTIDNQTDALVLTKRQNLFHNPLFLKGCFEIQDASSQLVAPFMDLYAGMRVIDACAGAGGKSLHIAALMQNKGRLVSMDVEDWKLQELKKRASRAGVGIIETRKIENAKTIKRLEESADRLLLDVPCSGLGVIRRNPDAKWKLSPDFLEKVKITQQGIFQDYARMLKKGGKLIYATCSILPSENTKQVEYFLSNNPQFKWIDEKVILSSETGFDGFFMAKLEKN